MGLMDWVISRGKKDRSRKVRIAAIVFGGSIFVVAVPCLLVYLALCENGEISTSEHPVFAFTGGVVSICGISLSLWTVWVQFHKGKGTPVPIMATKKVLVCKPYSFCRNPMGLGMIVFYMGISVIVRSYLAAGATVFIVLISVVYIKTFEEKELALRFGEEYMQYKKATPFMIPRISRLKRR